MRKIFRLILFYRIMYDPFCSNRIMCVCVCVCVCVISCVHRLIKVYEHL